MSDSKILELQTKSYNATFWQHYNIIKESPLDKPNNQGYLEKDGSLENQFKNNRPSKKRGER